MIALAVTACALCIVLSAYSIVITRIALNLREQLDTVARQIEESLDQIDGHYRNLSRILRMNVYIDDPVTRQIINETRLAHNALIKIAKNVSSSFQSEEIAESKDEDGGQ